MSGTAARSSRPARPAAVHHAPVSGVVAHAVRAVLLLAYLLPLAWILLTSFKTSTQVLRAPNDVLFTPTLGTYRAVVADAWTAVVTSLQVSAVVTAAVLVLGVPAAYALARRAGRRWDRAAAVVLAALLVLQMVPQPMTVIPLYSVLAGWGLLGTLGGLVLADVALVLPFAVMLLRPFVLAVPASLYEAAQLDGASQAQAFRLVTLPLLRNGVLTVLSVVFISTWGEFVYAVNFLPDGMVLPVSGLLARQTTTYAASWDSLMALAVLTSLPLLVVFVAAQRRLLGGLSLGAVR